MEHKKTLSSNLYRLEISNLKFANILKDLQWKKIICSVNVITGGSTGRQLLTVPGNEFNHRSIHYLHIMRDFKKKDKIQLAPNISVLTLYWTREHGTPFGIRRTKGRTLFSNSFAPHTQHINLYLNKWHSLTTEQTSIEFVFIKLFTIGFDLTKNKNNTGNTTRDNIYNLCSLVKGFKLCCS